MKHLFPYLTFLFLLLFQVQTVQATPFVTNDAQQQFLLENFGVTNADAFVNVSFKEVAEAKQKKLKLKEKVVLKLAQRQVKKQLKKSQKVDVEEIYESAERRFSIGGFLLGFFLGLIGVLIALLFGKNAVRSSLIGLLCWAIIVLIAVLAGGGS